VGASLFRGRYEHTIDAKGRTSVPSRYRDALSAAGEKRIVLTSALDACLVAYAMPEWAAFEERLSKLPQFDRAVQKLKRIYVSGAVECDIDDSGRILVPPTLRDYAALKKDVLWAGAGKYAELWDKDAWVAGFETTDAEKRDIAARLAELGL
jgi:MraZ protein